MPRKAKLIVIWTEIEKKEKETLLQKNKIQATEVKIEYIKHSCLQN